MDTILVVNAGSSSVKFQVFGADGELRRLIKGQMDGIGTRPRLCAEAGDKKLLVDSRYYSKETVVKRLPTGAADGCEEVGSVVGSKGADFDPASIAQRLNRRILGSFHEVTLP
jgi:Acetokinase family